MKRTIVLFLSFVLLCRLSIAQTSFNGRYWAVNDKSERIEYEVKESDKKGVYCFYKNGIVGPLFSVIMLNDSDFKIKPVCEVSDNKFFYEYRGKGFFLHNKVYLDLKVNRTLYVNGKQYNVHYTQNIFMSRVVKPVEVKDREVKSMRGPGGEKVYENDSGALYYYNDYEKVYIKK